jgi:hypothetical protein
LIQRQKGDRKWRLPNIYLSSKLRSMSNWKIEIRLGESSMLSPLLAFSYIFSPPTYHKAVIIIRDWTRYNKKHFSHWMKLTISISHKVIINQVFINNKQKSRYKISWCRKYEAKCWLLMHKSSSKIQLLKFKEILKIKWFKNGNCSYFNSRKHRRNLPNLPTKGQGTFLYVLVFDVLPWLTLNDLHIELAYEWKNCMKLKFKTEIAIWIVIRSSAYHDSHCNDLYALIQTWNDILHCQ